MVGLAVMAATPVMQRLEVPLAAVNSFTLRGVEQLEARFPILDQPADEVLGNLRDSLATGMEQLQASTTERVSQLIQRASRAVEDATGVAALGVNLFLNASAISQVLEPGAKAALSQMEQIMNHYLPATEEEIEKAAPSLTGMEQRSESERAYGRRLQLLMATSARHAYQRMWVYARGLWSLMRQALNQLLEFAVALRHRLYRALVALTETNDSDSTFWPDFHPGLIPVRLVQRRQYSLGGKSRKAVSEKPSFQDGSGPQSNLSPARRGIPATLCQEFPAKKARSPPPAASQLRKGRDLASLGAAM
ncbi:perilipin-2-like isoform X2 [Carettochelys insculpta]